MEFLDQDTKARENYHKYSSYANYLIFSLCSHLQIILLKDLQLKSRFKTKRDKAI